MNPELRERLAKALPYRPAKIQPEADHKNDRHVP